MAELQIRCLGGFQVAQDGTARNGFSTDKTRALLALLAVEDKVHARSALAELLWPGYRPDSARSSLRQCIHQLRRLLPDAEGEPPWFLLSRQTVQINPAAPIRVDVTVFTRLLAECAGHAHVTLASCARCRQRLREAVALYRGDFLGDLTVADCEPFEEWRRITQESLHIQLLDALVQLADAAENSGDGEGELWAAERQLALEPWLEAAHRRVMRLLVRRGQRAAALAQYQRCRQVLAAELQVEPDAETTALYAQIQRGEFGREPRPPALRPAAPDLPPPLSLPPAYHLPIYSTPLVGREDALAEVASRLQQPGVRLVTLVGAGGMGKTRLAVEVGRAHVGAFADGVGFVALAAIGAAPALPGAIAAALGITLQGGDPWGVLLAHLRHRHLLLILDEFEHLLAAGTEAVDLVVELLRMAPGVQILVTSRERLKLHGEQLYPVQALPFAAAVPESTASQVPLPAQTVAEAAALGAVRLFVQSVQRVQGSFQLTAANLPAVLRICRQVQGMPLGLELAAANAGGLPLGAIADAIARSAEFLAADWRDVPPRQRSMRAVFAWSWRLLSAEEQCILRQIAVFKGGFTYAAAEAVTGATLPLLARLIDKSLLQWQAAAGDDGRYALHELLREFAAEELHAAGEHSLLAARHARYYLAQVAACGPRLGGREPREASAEIQAELDNVRQAWQWAAGQGALAEVDEAAYGWWQFCRFADLMVEGRESFAAAVAGVRRRMAEVAGEAVGEDPDLRRGEGLLSKLLAIHANYLFAQGCDEEMAAEAEEAVRLGAASGGVEGETFGMFVLGRALQELDRKAQALACWQTTLRLVARYQAEYPQSELLHEAHWMAHNWLRGSALHFGDYAGSRTHTVQALAICRTLGKRRAELSCLTSLAELDFYRYDFAAAEGGFGAALELARALRYRRAEQVAKYGLAGLLRLRGDYQGARSMLEDAVRLAVELVFPYDEAFARAALVRLHCQLGDFAAAASCQAQLTDLLARRRLAKECRVYGYLAGACVAQAAGDETGALRGAEQADALNRSGGDILFRLVDTALILGHTRAAMEEWEGAAAAFAAALAAFQQFGKPALAAEPLAGLARLALAQGDLPLALAQVEPILDVLAQAPRAGYNNPFFIYLVCYRVLAAAADPRAAALLQQGCELLLHDAAALDTESRHRFLAAVPSHRDLLAASTALPAQAGSAARS